MDTPDTASIAEAAGFRFLDLPSELRNKIYDLCVENTIEGYPEEDHYCYIWFWYHRRGYLKFKDLTQVCRQIRAEYLPLYNKRTIFAVDVEELTRYIDTLVLLPGVAEADVAGKIVVVGKCHEATELNLGALMSLTNKARSLVIKWYDAESRKLHGLTPLFDTFFHFDDDPILRDYISRSLTKIELLVEGWPMLEICLSVRKECWENWMGKGNDWMRERNLGGRYKRAMKKWAAAAHIPYFSSTPYCMSFTQDE